ncbi:MAG TPA: pyrroline-5-carboxylate reductase [Candidatus Acidoferrales bacterium]|nr:pyrroline-5-carboxylate reductase [Candidatus Acidoferrales bacterium]HVC38798.1 pyrroline-5-carboxylate reductase [Candidatus Dormibacteraeota bacterium]
MSPPEPAATSPTADLSSSSFGVVGAGVMAEAMIAGLLRRGLVSSSQVVCSHPRAERARELATRLGVTVLAGNQEVASRADILLLAVKPQVLPRVMRQLDGTVPAETLVISIVAGASTAALSAGIAHRAIVRAMPNTPAQIGQGVTVWFATQEVSAPAKAQVRALLSALGSELEVEDERQVAMATAVSGTGPTYAFLFSESLVEAAVHLGFPRHLARRLVLETLRGSIEFAIQSGEHPAQLRDMVTSPGGTSAEALAALERGRFRTVLGDAVWAAFRRTLQLEASLEEDPSGGPPPSA